MQKKNERVIPVRVTQASLNQTAFDFPWNLKNIFDAIDEAVAQQSDILTLGEMTLIGDDMGDDIQKSDNAVAAELLQDIAHYAHLKNPNLLVQIGHPWRLAQKNMPVVNGVASERRKNALYNRVNQPFNVQTILGEGRILAMTAKNYLFNYERGFEKRYYAEWSNAEADKVGGRFGTISIHVPGQKQAVPFGRPVITLNSRKGRVNLTQVICEEKWVASRFDDGDGSDKDYEKDGVLPDVARYMGKKGLVALIANASPPAPLKIKKHVHLAKLASCYADAVIDTDNLGTSGSTFAQHGHRLAAQDGELISYGGRYSFKRVDATSHTFFVEPADETLSQHAHIAVNHEFDVPQWLKKTTPRQAPAWDDLENPHLNTEETMRMASLWLFDYMRKNKTQGIVEAISGGMDSAFNCVLVGTMVRLAMTELGVEGFCREMGHLRYKDSILEANRKGGMEAAYDACMENMLTTVYMGTNNSSEATRHAAKFTIKGGERKEKKVKGVGGKYYERNVQELIDFFAAVYAVENTSKLNEHSKKDLLRELGDYFNLRPGVYTPLELEVKLKDIKQRYPEITGEILSAADANHGTAYESIQARVRQVVIMAFANAEGKLPVANPNLDEARNSNTTYGGDLHSGTINLNGFIAKEQQIEVMRDIMEQGLDGVPPVECLYYVMSNKPTAELLPKDASGNVVQSDEGFLQRSFKQMDCISHYMLNARTGEYNERRLNPLEVYNACKKEPIFEGLSTDALHNMVRFSYVRWWFSQFKIHAAPITPTYGSNVDHQTSLRTPNISGQDRAQLTQLGVHVLFDLAKDECGVRHASLDGGNKPIWLKRSYYDADFIDRFDNGLRAFGSQNHVFGLDGLYQAVNKHGLEETFGPVNPMHLFLAKHTQREHLAHV